MNWLKDYDEVAASTEVKKADGKIPDGNHRLYIKDAALDPATKTVKYKLVLPDTNSREITKVSFLFNKKGEPQFEWVKGDTLAVLPELAAEVEAGRPWLLSELPDYLAQMVGKVVAGNLKTPAGKEYANIYFNGLAASQEVEPIASW